MRRSLGEGARRRLLGCGTAGLRSKRCEAAAVVPLRAFGARGHGRGARATSVFRGSRYKSCWYLAAARLRLLGTRISPGCEARGSTGSVSITLRASPKGTTIASVNVITCGANPRASRPGLCLTGDSDWLRRERGRNPKQTL